MGNVNALLSERLKKGDHSPKMKSMATQSASGQLTSFSGVFGVTDLTDKEKTFLETLLQDHSEESNNISKDLSALISISSEVKAINNQAVILHGERIKKAHSILTHYRDGAFTAWLIAMYGNRQTPYNFLQYYEFYEALPKVLRPQIEAMPRQAVYALASREAPLPQKQEIVESYQGETKTELLQRIRDRFPLAVTDKRRQNIGVNTIQSLTKLHNTLQKSNLRFTDKQKREILGLIESLRAIVA